MRPTIPQRADAVTMRGIRTHVRGMGTVIDTRTGPGDALRSISPAGPQTRMAATARTADRTGVEMEALTSVAVAGLTVIDMVKAVDPRASITDVRLLAKSGGKSGDWTRDGGR